MVITSRVSSEFFEHSQEQRHDQLIRIAPHQGRVHSPVPPPPGSGPAWTNEEHERFLEAMELFPSGPWKVIANYVGSKTPRQAMTHAQKYRQKIARRKRGLKTNVKQSDDGYFGACASATRLPIATSPVQAATSPVTSPVREINSTENTAATSANDGRSWSSFTTPQVVMQEHRDFVRESPPDSPLFENDSDYAAFLLEDYEPLWFVDDAGASPEDEHEISRILEEFGW